MWAYEKIIGFNKYSVLKEALLKVKKALIPVAAFACDSCGHINKEFQDAPITAQ